MTGDAELFEWIAPVEKGPVVVFVDNSKGKVMGTGKIQGKECALTDVSLVTNLKHNLISISQLGESGYECHFNKHNCSIIDEDTGKTVLTGNKVGGVYIVNWESKSEDLNCLVSGSADKPADANRT